MTSAPTSLASQSSQRWPTFNHFKNLVKYHNLPMIDSFTHIFFFPRMPAVFFCFADDDFFLIRSCHKESMSLELGCWGLGRDVDSERWPYKLDQNNCDVGHRCVFPMCCVHSVWHYGNMEVINYWFWDRTVKMCYVSNVFCGSVNQLFYSVLNRFRDSIWFDRLP